MDSTYPNPVLHAATTHLNLGEFSIADSLARIADKFRYKLIPPMWRKFSCFKVNDSIFNIYKPVIFIKFFRQNSHSFGV